MTRRPNVAAFLSSLFALALIVGGATPSASALTNDQQSCVNGINKAGAKVASTQGKENSSCVKSAADVDVDTCITADSKQKVSGAQSKTTSTQSSKCSSPFPPFAYTSASNVNTVTKQAELDLLAAIFGSPVDSAMLADKDGASCQTSISKSYEKLASTRLKEFNSCKKAGLKDGSISSSATLQPCVLSDPKQKVSGAKTKLGDTITKKCEGVTLASAFPGCSAEAGSDSALRDCVARKVACQTCLMENQMDGMSAPCDQYDDGVVNGTCAQCGNSQVDAGEACDSGGVDAAGCDSDCTAVQCGDFHVNTAAGEACDAGGVSTASCDSDCSAVVCGDGLQNSAAGETCDDGNLDDDDGCDSNCTITACGNGIVTTGETCDTAGDSMTCDSDCTAVACGDGHVNTAAGEACDGGGVDTASCDANCTSATCGDGYVNAAAGELCDDGNVMSGDGCSATCQDGPGSGEQDAQCPDVGELVLYSHDSLVTCTDNSDCTAPRTCDTSLGRCTTVASLDSGWTGAGHAADIDDGVRTRATLLCEGPNTPTGCGQCTVTGIDPEPRNCRCSNNTRTVCDKPFAADATNCGGATCDCYFGAPFPLVSLGTPVCVVNRFAQDISGTADVDAGAGEIAASLRSKVFLGATVPNPCPTCSGTCSANPSLLCANDAECTGTCSGGHCSNNNTVTCSGDGDCYGGPTCDLDTPDDGVRDGVCAGGANNGQTCDAMGVNPSYPAEAGTTGGGEYSLDCMPSAGSNVSGAGLQIVLNQTTGSVSLPSGLDCDGAGAGTESCPCLVCSKDSLAPCTADSDCTSQGGSCTTYTNPTKFNCTTDANCADLDLGNCTAIGGTRCSLATGKSCGTNADCKHQNGGTCAISTCTGIGTGEAAHPNQCAGGLCDDLGGGLGQCTTGPDDLYCDNIVTAGGNGIFACAMDADCAPAAIGLDGGTCSLSKRRACFLDPITATGTPDSSYPVAVAAFCIPPTSAPGINSVAGLPGPGRVRSQGAATTFCASNHALAYTPGGDTCP